MIIRYSFVYRVYHEFDVTYTLKLFLKIIDNRIHQKLNMDIDKTRFGRFDNT